MNPFVYLLFFVSGISGLIYQVIWVREFGQIFGNTVQSAAIVSGTFVFGLGLGSYLAGRFIDRIHRSKPTAGLLYYAYSEIGIALLGLALVFLIPRLEALAPLISHYHATANGWQELSGFSYLWRYLIAMVLIGPITVLMGATLTLLIRYLLSHSIQAAGWSIGWLYGINTLGAAFGCALVDLWAIPAIGIMKTKLIAVALNFVCGFGAVGLVKRLNPAATSLATPMNDAQSQTLWPLGLAIAISGFCAMGMEIVWFRFLSSNYVSAPFTFSVLLAVLLIGIWLGSILSGALSRKFQNPARLYVYAQLLFAATVMVGFFLIVKTTRLYFYDDLTRVGGPLLPIALFDYFNVIASALKTLFLPAVFMGFAYPLMNDLGQRRVDHVGVGAGTIYLWNASGAFLGSIITGFVLLPVLGIQTSVAVLVCGATLAILPVCLNFERTFRDWKIQLVTLVVLGTGAYWLSLPANLLAKNTVAYELFSPNGKQLVRVSEGINEVAMISETPSEGGDGTKPRDLFTNGHIMSSTVYMAQRYQRAFAHLPLLQMDDPKSVMVICFGVGNTLHAASLHPSVDRLEIVDLSKNVLGLASYFQHWNKNILDDRRVQVVINDGRQHLRIQPENSYDLITLEPPPLGQSGVASLYSEEFYRLAHRALRGGGYLTQWLPINQIDGDLTRRLIKSFLDVFPNAVLLNGAYQDFILIGQKDGSNQVDWRRFQERLLARSAVLRDLKRVDLSEPVEWLGMFTASAKLLQVKLKNTKPMTDDDPVIEYGHLENLTHLPKELFDTGGLADWCPSCFQGDQLVSELAPLEQYLAVAQGIYQSDEFTFITPERMNQRPTFVLSIARPGSGSGVMAASFLRFPTEIQVKDLLVKFPYIANIFGPGFRSVYTN